MENIKYKNGRKHLSMACKVCGKIMFIREDYFNKHSGNCMSCTAKNNSHAKKHGKSKSRLYKIWVGLSYRRGYTHTPSICKEWKDFLIFEKWALSHGYLDNLTIDRIDNTLGYSANNCQWITLEENAGKDKLIFKDSEIIDIYNQRKAMDITQVEMARLLDVSRNTIQRLEKRSKELLDG